jgi:hypothetical protein
LVPHSPGDEIQVIDVNQRGNMSRLDSFKAKTRALAKSGSYYGLPPLLFELSFEEGFQEAREWLALASTREELERLCQTSRAKRHAA